MKNITKSLIPLVITLILTSCGSTIDKTEKASAKALAQSITDTLNAEQANPREHQSLVAFWTHPLNPCREQIPLFCQDVKYGNWRMVTCLRENIDAISDSCETFLSLLPASPSEPVVTPTPQSSPVTSPAPSTVPSVSPSPTPVVSTTPSATPSIVPAATPSATPTTTPTVQEYIYGLFSVVDWNGTYWGTYKAYGSHYCGYTSVPEFVQDNPTYWNAATLQVDVSTVVSYRELPATLTYDGQCPYALGLFTVPGWGTYYSNGGYDSTSAYCGFTSTAQLRHYLTAIGDPTPVVHAYDKVPDSFSLMKYHGQCAYPPGNFMVSGVFFYSDGYAYCQYNHNPSIGVAVPIYPSLPTGNAFHGSCND